MEELIIELQQYLGKVKQKFSDLVHHETVLNQREKEIDDKISGHADKHQELLSREASIAHVENILSIQQTNEAKSQEISDGWNKLEEARKAFKIYQDGELGNMAESKKTLDAGWAELNQAIKKQDDIVDAKVKDLVSKFKK
jgi:hypothetical protein